MTRTMYDAVNASAIPPNAAMVAGYIDQIRIPPWTAADWARFPNAIKVRIAKKATTNDGHVLDVEPGDATPAEAPGWVRMRRAAGADPTIYCSASAWSTVIAAFRSAGVAQPHYWIAHYDGDPALPTLGGITAVAKQYRDPGPYDVSSVADYWPGVDTPRTPPEEIDMEQSDLALDYDGKTPAKDGTGHTYTVAGGLKGTNVGVWQAVALLQAQSAQLAGLIAAIQQYAAANGSQVTLEQITDAVDKAVAAHMPTITGTGELSGTVTIGPAGPPTT